MLIIDGTTRRSRALAAATLLVMAGWPTPFAADQLAADQPPAERHPVKVGSKGRPALVRLSKEYGVWFDLERRLVVIDGEVSLREGPLELFACLKNSKEHESIVAVDAKAWLVHTALLLTGAQVGHPVQYDLKYVPAAGTAVDVLVLWMDKDKKRHRVHARDWIRNVNTQKAMKGAWVFAGSGFYVDEETGRRFYLAEEGDLICVSNFTTATLDLPIQSGQDNANLLFEAFTERIPPRGTKVRIVLIPKLAKKKGKGRQNSGPQP